MFKTQAGSVFLQGLPIVDGIAIGRAWIGGAVMQLHPVLEHHILHQEIPAEKKRFLQALEYTRHELISLHKTFSSFALFEAYILILESPSLKTEVINLIELGHGAVWALHQVIESHRLSFERIKNTYLQLRVNDLFDLADRLFTHLQADKIMPIAKKVLPEDIILLLEEVSVANLVDIPRHCLKGIICAKGSNHSHLAILARAMGIPTVMGVQNLTSYLSLSLGEIIINGTTGEICLFPTDAMRNKVNSSTKQAASPKTYLTASFNDNKHLTEAVPMILCANSDAYTDMQQAITLGAQGVGLYRSEVAFMMHNDFPTEQVQYTMYKKVLRSFAPYPVSIRILDVGGDKSLPYFTPKLGSRGIKMMLAHPDIFLSQLRAILRASQGFNNVNILLPMVSSIEDLDRSIAFIHQAYQEVNTGAMIFPFIGAMIEVPCAVFQIRAIVQRVDFVSVGSNDLTQYLLATDREDSRLTSMYDSLHPAVLRALHIVVQATHIQNKKVSICGEMAADPIAVIALLGLGFDMLSMQAKNLPIITWILRHFTKATAHALMVDALLMDRAQDIRTHLEAALAQVGLDCLIKPIKPIEENGCS